VIADVARASGGTVDDVYGMATFCSFLSVEPLGAHVIMICKSIPCHRPPPEQNRLSSRQDGGSPDISPRASKKGTLGKPNQATSLEEAIYESCGAPGFVEVGTRDAALEAFSDAPPPALDFAGTCPYNR